MDRHPDFRGISSGVSALGVIAVAEQEDPGEILLDQAAPDFLEGPGDVCGIPVEGEGIERIRRELAGMGGEAEIAGGHAAVEPGGEGLAKKAQRPLAAADSPFALLHARRQIDGNGEQGGRGLHPPELHSPFKERKDDQQQGQAAQGGQDDAHGRLHDRIGPAINKEGDRDRRQGGEGEIKGAACDHGPERVRRKGHGRNSSAIYTIYYSLT
ncbi:MAG: hypothetical protein BWY77_01373 [bacterium ADurb.Bin431]|nr:MAG: hypothetical protein BWY77_01373 [bacterium ADurb.Bin431]